jgi:hypothetical protein
MREVGNICTLVLEVQPISLEFIYINGKLIPRPQHNAIKAPQGLQR